MPSSAKPSGVPRLVEEPSTPKGRATRQRILDAARTVFARSGYVAARMSDVAAEANLSLGGLYRYYGNKEGLFEALIEGLHDELYTASTSTHDLHTEPYEALLQSNLGYLRVYADNRDVMRAFIEAANVDDRFRRQWWRMRERHIARYLHVHPDPSTLAGPPAQADPELVVEALAAMVEEAAFIWFAHGRGDHRAVSVEEAAGAVTQAWFRTAHPHHPRSR